MSTAASWSCPLLPWWNLLILIRHLADIGKIQGERRKKHLSSFTGPPNEFWHVRSFCMMANEGLCRLRSHRNTNFASSKCIKWVWPSQSMPKINAGTRIRTCWSYAEEVYCGQQFGQSVFWLEEVHCFWDIICLSRQHIQGWKARSYGLFKVDSLASLEKV